MSPDGATRHPRLTPCRPDLAAAALEGSVVAPRFVAGAPMQVAAPLADVRRAPRADAPLDTQAAFGAIVTCFDRDEGWAWVQIAADGYVGYMPAADLAVDVGAPTHVVVVARTFVYPRPDMKTPPLLALPLGAVCDIVGHEGAYAKLDAGFVHAAHLREIGATAPDFVAIAEALIGTPYLWGGASPLGIDCSGLVQIALRCAGRPVLRDTDMQEASVGTALPPDVALQRGDLVFWAGHVGIMRDADTLLHANAHHMLVASEPLVTARTRIAANGGAVRVVRRL